MFRHGAGLALDMTNALRRSKIETSRYECKQGFVDLSTARSFDTSLPDKIVETICGIANVGPDADGFLFIGVADKKSDAERVKLLDKVEPVTIGERYVVGLEREMKILGLGSEQYLEKITGYIKRSELSEPLKSQVLSQTDYVEFKGLSVLRIRIPRQNNISFVGEDVFTRENSSTIKITGKKLLAINGLFNN